MKTETATELYTAQGCTVWCGAILLASHVRSELDARNIAAAMNKYEGEDA